MSDNPFVPGDDKVSPAITGGLQLPADQTARERNPVTKPPHDENETSGSQQTPVVPLGIGEPLIVHGGMSSHDRDARVAQLLETVGLSPDYRKRYPHEFSGGQRQRIGVARALATNRSSSCSMSRSPRSTCPCRRRSSICCRIC